MNRETGSAPGQPSRYSPVWHLVLARLREFYREPEAVFWVYGFPVLLVVSLGLAFRNQPVEALPIAVVAGPADVVVTEVLGQSSNLPRAVTVTPTIMSREEARRQLRAAKVTLAVIADVPTNGAGSSAIQYQYWYDPERPESLMARAAVDDALQRHAGRRDPLPVSDEKFDEPGGRYIDFLVPGLLGMSIMGGGLWGVGFVTVDMRIRKLLKRFLATPMRKSHFLAGIMISRLAFLVPEVAVLIVFARWAFGVRNYGDWGSLLALILLGAASFAGIGLLVASRAKTMEAVSGLMNLVMLPMWVFSGVFFSPDRFPDFLQPLIRALPLTVLIGALRAVMLDGLSLVSQLWPVLTLLGWAVVSFWIALRIFRWN